MCLMRPSLQINLFNDLKLCLIFQSSQVLVMGCNVSKETVKVVHRKSESSFQDTSKADDNEIKLEGNGCTMLPASPPPQIPSYMNSSILAPHTYKSVELKNGVVSKDNPPVAMATIIRGAPETPRPKNNTPPVKMQLPHQTDDSPSGATIKKTVVITRPLAQRTNVAERRSSEGDVKKSSNKTCVTRPFGKDGLPVRGGSLPDLQKSKSSPFGPRNSRLVLTQSQIDFFRMLDEKVAQGKDYCSEDDQSLASMQSWHNPRKDSSSSNGVSIKLMQEVR